MDNNNMNNDEKRYYGMNSEEPVNNPYYDAYVKAAKAQKASQVAEDADTQDDVQCVDTNESRETEESESYSEYPVYENEVTNEYFYGDEKIVDETPSDEMAGYTNKSGQNSFSSDGSYGGSNSGNGPSEKKNKSHKSGRIVALVLAFALLVSGSGAAGVYVGSRLVQGSNGQNVVGENSGDQGNAQIEFTETSNDSSSSVAQVVTAEKKTASVTDVSCVVESATPSIVAINCTGEYVTNYFGRKYTQQTGGSGSGIIIGQNDDEILIVTNNHVVDLSGVSSLQIDVVFCNDVSVPATIKGTESGSDLAVIAVKTADIDQATLNTIRIATLGDSDALKVGEMAIAIGNALGYGQSTTVGYISALHREVATEDYTMELIQTDAAINPGNSGGALLNIYGEVIGINSVKYADESVEGMGFAIPISDAIPIINELMNREEIPEEEQAYLGIIGQNVTESYNRAYGMPIGVYVYEVSENSPAVEAGLQMGDVITKFNTSKIETMTDLQNKLATHRAGEVITLTVKRLENGSYKELTLTVTLGQKNK